jgi:predicted glycogen debranching enzyme
MENLHNEFYHTFEGFELQSSMFNTEWLLTDGMGGWASQLLSGSLSRRYHSLFLVNSKKGKINYLPQVEEFVGQNELLPIATNFYSDVIYPTGYLKIEKILVGPTIQYFFRIGEDLLLKEIFKPKFSNNTFISYEWFGKSSVNLSLVPLLSLTSFHNLRKSTKDNLVNIERSTHGLFISSFEGYGNFYLESHNFSFENNQDWFYGLRLAEEQERGLDSSADLFSIVKLNTLLKSGSRAIFSISLNENLGSLLENFDTHKDKLFNKIKNFRPKNKLQQSKVESTLNLSLQDYFINTNRNKAGVIAGYHWFEEWGRDTFIVLSMLTELELEEDESKIEQIFQIFQDFFFKNSNGILPNRFISTLNREKEFEAEYNSVDSLLWGILALWNFNKIFKDQNILKPLWQSAFKCLDNYIQGSDFGIYVDRSTSEFKSLLFAGDQNTQLTWMDARVNGIAITPRNGACVEINALWYNCLRICQIVANTFEEINTANQYEKMAIEAYSSFRKNFCLSDLGYLADVVRDDYKDYSFRPNQLFAISLPFPLLDNKEARLILFKIEKELLTSFGLRTLSFKDPSYKPVYKGGPLERDSAYHQGTVWPWLMWAYTNAVFKYAENDLRPGLEKVVENLSSHLFKSGYGHVSEVFGGDDNRAGGSIAQAWSTMALKYSLEKLRS